MTGWPVEEVVTIVVISVLLNELGSALHRKDNDRNQVVKQQHRSLNQMTVCHSRCFQSKQRFLLALSLNWQ